MSDEKTKDATVVELPLLYPQLDEITPELVQGLRKLCWVSDRVCRGLELHNEFDEESDLEFEISEEDIPWLKEFRRHLVNYSRARAFSLCATALSLTELGEGRALFADPVSAYHRLVMHGFYEAQHTNDARGYVTSGVAISQVKKMGSKRTKRSLRTLLRQQVESGSFQELQTSRDQRFRHIIPAYQTRLTYETAATLYCLCMARLDRSGSDAAAGVDNIANMANAWLEKKFEIYFLAGKIPPFAWDNRIVGLIDIDEEDGDESDLDSEALEV